MRFSIINNFGFCFCLQLFNALSTDATCDSTSTWDTAETSTRAYTWKHPIDQVANSSVNLSKKKCGFILEAARVDRLTLRPSGNHLILISYRPSHLGSGKSFVSPTLSLQPIRLLFTADSAGDWFRVVLARLKRKNLSRVSWCKSFISRRPLRLTGENGFWLIWLAASFKWNSLRRR